MLADGPPGASGMVDILFLLERLDEVAAGPRVPLTSRILVDEQEYLEIVDQIRLALPEEITRARRLLSDRDRILAEASDRAEHLLGRAEQQIAHRVDDHEIVRAADQRAQELLDAARAQAEDIRRQADDYAYQVLQALQRRLRKLDRAVQDELTELTPEQSD